MKGFLEKGLRDLGIAPSGGQLDRFMTCLAELKRWNRAYSLTSLKTDEDIVIKHFLDSALYVKVMEEVSIPDKKLPVAVADVGSGAGFPGLVIKILRPEVEIYLIEPTRKKTAFLRHMVRTLGLEGAHAIGKRIEEVGGIEVDFAVTRALFKVEDFVKKASHIVREGGFFIMSKGPSALGEIKDMKLEYKLKKLPMSDIERHFVIIRRERGPLLKKASTAIHKARSGTVCTNVECRLRRAGCSGFEACPGFRGR
jgi:16S rRNA (guanine527-N7)-methyltransferase